MSESAKKRIEAVDVAKGIGIVAIVVGHLAFVEPGGAKLIHNALYQFHVPIFFLLEGCFLKPSKPTTEFIASRAKRLLGPYVVTCVVIGVLIYGLAAIGIEPLERYRTGILDFVEACFYGSPTKNTPGPLLVKCPHIGAVWFLAALFIASVEVKLCMRVRKAAPFIIGTLVAFAISTRSKVWLPFDIQPAFVGAIYVYLGVLARGHGLLELKASALVNAVLVLMYVICCLYSITVSIAVANIGPYFLGLPVSLCASYLVLQLSHYIADRTKTLKQVLVFFGKNSLIVLCVHLVFLDAGFDRFLLWLGLDKSTNAMQFVNLAVQLMVCAGVSAIMPKTRFLKRIFC